MHIVASLGLFVACYAFIIVVTSVGYHRGLAHGAVQLRAPLRWLLMHAGIWLTGVDAKTWVVMHRLHHAHSDTPDDPHTPTRKGVLGFLAMFREQLAGYDRVAGGRRGDDARYAWMGRDL
jgi:stearoyl-CoA desaturase (delta-9 desaturase)